jgi:hypothetical protein
MRRTARGVVLAALVLTASAAVANAPLTLKTLSKMECCELEQLYRQSPPGTVPQGFTPGRAMYCRTTPLAGLRSAVVNLAWRGKHFDACRGTLVNQWVGLRAIEAQVHHGESWLDGGPSIIMDYRGTSRVWRTVRDELREVAPGLYLGIMYEERCTGPKFRMFFALEACPCTDH